MAKALVIGANGFIGSHLVDALAEAGHEVTAFGRFRTRVPRFSSPDVRLLPGEFLDRSDLDHALRGTELVFHLLSTTTPVSAQGDPSLDARSNVVPTIQLLESAVAAGVERLFFASTGGAIYGSQGRDEYRETDPTLPISPYAIGKLSIENYLRFFDVVHGLRSTALRISNPYGPRQPDHRRQGLIPIALRRAIAGQPVIQYGDGSMVRDYIYVADLVAMILRMVGREPSHPVYNLGSGTGHTITEVFDAIRKAIGSDFETDLQPTPATFVDRVVLDTTRYRDEFGGVELTSLDDGVRATYDEIRSSRD